MGKHDPRLPTVHVCYLCLNIGEVDPVLENHVLFRRALWLLQRGSFEDTKSFSQALGKLISLVYESTVLTLC
jgi:hypothetical protein